MIYDYFLTVYDLIVGLLNGKILVNIGICAIVLYVVWVTFALSFCFAAKFIRRSSKLTKFVKTCEATPENLENVISTSKQISSGLEMGLKRFKNNGGFVSNYVSKQEALDSEFNAGTFNHGKSLMKTYTWILTAFLFITNLGVLASTSELTGGLLAQAMVLPLVFYFLIKIFYFVYVSIQQQLYRLCEEYFYELVDALDQKFVGVEETNKTASDVKTEETEESEVLENNEEQKEEKIEPEASEEVEEDHVVEQPKKTLEDYDFFKKKNIDVDKFVGEIPASSTLPYIDVDSDYVIKDDESTVNSYHPAAKNGGEVLGGMMHNMSAVKKEEEKNKEKSKFEQQENKDVETEAKPETDAKDLPKKSKKEEDDVFGNLDSLEEYKIDDEDDKKPLNNSSEDADPPSNRSTGSAGNPEDSEKLEENKETQKQPNSTESSSFDVSSFKIEDINEEDEDKVTKETYETTETEDNFQKADTENDESLNPQEESEFKEDSQPSRFDENQTFNKTENDFNSDEEHIANLVGKFKPKSKLASGGVIIERNDGSGNAIKNEESFSEPREVKVLNTQANEDDVISAMRNTQTFGVEEEQYFDDYSQNQFQPNPNVQYNPQFAQNYYGGTMDGNFMGFNGEYPEDMPEYQYPNMGVNQNGYVQFAQPNVAQEGYVEGIDRPAERQTRKVEMNAPIKRQRTTTKPKTEPNLVSQEKVQTRVTKSQKVETVSKPEIKTAQNSAPKRGRPSKQVFDDDVTIKNDKEFEQVLSRAEKLMRKSEEGLSPSQSKRVEKELKTLLDALNKYKENK